MQPHGITNCGLSVLKRQVRHLLEAGIHPIRLGLKGMKIFQQKQPSLHRAQSFHGFLLQTGQLEKVNRYQVAELFPAGLLPHRVAVLQLLDRVAHHIVHEAHDMHGPEFAVTEQGNGRRRAATDGARQDRLVQARAKRRARRRNTAQKSPSAESRQTGKG